MLPFSSINPVAIVVCFVIAMALGFLWYAQFAFGALWLKLNGLQNTTPEDVQKAMPRTMATSIANSIITPLVLAAVIEAMNITDVSQAMLLTFWLWLGFTAMALASLNAYTRKSTTLLLIDIGYPLVSGLIMAAVIVLMG